MQTDIQSDSILDVRFLNLESLCFARTEVHATIAVRTLGCKNIEEMLPILGGANHGQNWAARIAKLQGDLAKLAESPNVAAAINQHLKQMFVKSESALTDSPPPENALSLSFELLMNT
ncbi:MAG TPA: hypothetical protein VFC63_28275, partial [Blastocatellia bacterium]|nr:hypothetical protein [Blastocatellia bacterium]